MRKWNWILILLFIFSSCIKEDNNKTPDCVENGVIVCQESIWKVPFNGSPALIYPYPQFDNRVIVGTNNGENFGLRCMDFETGNIFWEYYLDIQAEFIIIQDTYFNHEQGFLIFKVGSWGNKEHIKLDIHTGDVLWRSPIESFSGMEAYADHYYCTVRSSGDAHSIYKVDIKTGHAEFFYETDLPPDSEYNAQRANWALPFEHNGKEYLFIGIMQMTSPNSSNYYYSLMEAETKERILKHIPIETTLDKVVVHNGSIYVFTGNGYKIFNMETLTFEEEVKLLDRGHYVYHHFYKDKLILGLDYYGISGIDDNGQSHTHFILDATSNRKLFSIDKINVNKASVMDDILYFVSSDEYYAYDLKTGRCILNFEPSGYEIALNIAGYENSKGKKFIVLGDSKNTYCYEGI